ncbi:hypothetical protein H5410_031499 [Solanum commersonii]|uniref:Reverse transcriptase domain-containing protein n=1 Tax=Solanum commersonii TaxID=4109 RepID=A0A9J5YIK0_SOLCO|nr:hypothetical protein H5410_031499 [Solanum commersonii]
MPSGENMQRVKDKYNKYFHFEEMFWQQKGLWLEDERDMTTKTVEHFSESVQTGYVISYGEEVKNVMFRFNGDSSSGPDGLTVLSRIIHDRLENILPNLISCFVKGESIIENGDPLSPTLFILSAKVFSRALNSLFDDPQLVGYEMPKWSVNLNHLAYVDDTIILLHLIIILWGKSWLFYTVMKRNHVKRGSFPMKYFECPITHSRENKEHSLIYLKK